VKLSVKARMQLPGTTEGVGWTVGSTVPQWKRNKETLKLPEHTNIVHYRTGSAGPTELSI